MCKLNIVVALISLFGGTVANILQSGQCETIHVDSEFDITKFAGTWYEIEAYPKDQQGGQCISHEYFVINGTNQLGLQSSQIVDQFLVITSGVVTPDSANSARLTIDFTTGEETTNEYWVLATDYDSYALVYSCENIDEEYRLVRSWKLSRTKELSAPSVLAINAAISGIQVLDDRYYVENDQSPEGCFYYPKAVEGVPMVFPGQCNSSMPVVAHFNITQFEGRWHVIESYPTGLPEGDCQNHIISAATDSTWNVVSSSVSNVSLNNSTSVLVASATELGRLTITLTSDTGVPLTVPLWVLDTDYENYTLVYSCVDNNDNTRNVYSWKLGRSKTLSSEALTLIDTTMNHLDDLRNDYFWPVDQRDEACFYLPDLQPGEPAIFPGQCDPNISVVQNFDALRYLGLWHTIKSYSSPSQLGTCNNSHYYLGNGVINVFNTEVKNQALSTINGIVYIDENEPAKLLVQFPSVTNATTEYWVLATDYDSYALVYSCENIDEEYRLVHSWKLSRTKELSAPSVVAINAATSGIQVLDDRYYVENDQSPEACFYYPDTVQALPMVFPGQCNSSMPVVAHFNITQFEGRWHVIESYPTGLPEGDCQNHIISAATDSTWNVVSSSVNHLSLNNSTSVLVASTTELGGLTITLTSDTGVPLTVPLWVLDTDYENYTLVYSCVDNNDDTRNVYSWKLGRSKTLSLEALTLIDTTMNHLDDLRNDYFWSVDQRDEACFYLPDLQPGEPAIFPGQCDPNISVVPNFDALRYLGLWYTIESYSSPSQLGTCNNAHYSLGNGVINVFNTEVRNQTFSTINGIAYIDENEPAKILVQFPSVTNASTEYWVLATDYDSYALVYSCANIDEKYRLVHSWKLSRTKELSAPSVVDINAATSSIQVLDDRYYVENDQSPEGCFYYPNAVEGVPMVFPGQCNSSMPVVAHFNITQFEGRWHVIESYPTGLPEGDCQNHMISAATDSTWNVVSSSVSNLSLNNSTSVLVASATELGRLTITLTSDTGVPVTLPLWVLDTDYDNYTLVYSCVDNHDDTRNVYSWKLGRSKTLSSDALTLIDTTMSHLDDLRNDYFWPVDQSDEACFYLPDLQPGEPVIFPGQCDPNISVVPNFDALSYTGRWYQIERYPQIHENGDCTGAEYSLDEETGVVTLLNWEVIDGELDTIEGTAVITSTDGSAKLMVTLPVDGTEVMTETTLYVLTTDYESYSLAYSCVNINDFQRAVAAWKLSRTRTMPGAGTTAINAYMATRQELHQPYFIQVAQSEDCEEPNSSTFIRGSIIVTLICLAIKTLM